MMVLRIGKFSVGLGIAAAAILTAGAMIVSTANADTAPKAGQVAPAFTGTTAKGDSISLEDFNGKTVVLEWTNHGCPFVQKHYALPETNMQKMQISAEVDDIVWISVISSAPGKQGHVDGVQVAEINADRGAIPAHTILDESGEIGMLYGAKTTPHMFVIDGDGEVVFHGGIDDKPSAKVADIPNSRNHVTEALADMAEGEDIEVPFAKPYGCSVKYAG